MADETRNEYKLVQDKMGEMKPLFDRMDEDEKLYLLDPFKMKRLPPHDSKEERDVANVTTNDPLLYAKKAIAITGSYQRNAVIEGQNLTDKQTSKIEQFQDDLLYVANEWLVKRDIPSLEAYIIEQACIRGGIPGRVCIRSDGEGGIIPDILPIDRRWFPYDNDQNGFIWCGPIFKRSKAAIEKEYPDIKVNLKTHGNEVVDFWDGEKEVVFIEKKIAKENQNTYKSPPFVQAICPIGTMLNTEESMKHHGESIFWPNRGLWKEKNETTTILKTLSRKALKGGLELQQSTNSPDKGKKPGDSPYKEDVVIPTEIGGGFRQLPVNDIKSATRLLYSILEACLQRGELTPLDYGTLTFPLSSVAILNLLAARNDIFAPILSMIASFYRSLTRMVIDQCVALGTTIKLGKDGSYNTYSPSDFKGEYSISYHFTLLSKEQTAADLALATNARGLLSDDYIRRDMLKVDNPDGMKFEIQSEEAERTDEVLFLYRRAASLIVMSDGKQEPEKTQMQIEAEILCQRIETILTQRRNMGQLSPIEGKQELENKGEELLPLFSRGGGGARGTPQSQEGENAED